MRSRPWTPSRRAFLAALSAYGAVAPGSVVAAQGSSSPMPTRAIPGTSEHIPMIGMGSWITFNVGHNTELRDHRVKVLQQFFDMGGGMIDSSPMYGSSEDVIGFCLAWPPPR